MAQMCQSCNTISPYYGGSWRLPNQFITKVWEGNPLNVWDQVKQYNEDALHSCEIGFNFNVFPVAQKYLKLQEIYDAMPGQLDQKNKRFQLNSLGKGISYDRVANDFLWLKDAGVAIPVYNISEPKSPLIISENRNLFKLFFSDVGLLTSCYSNQVKVAILNKDKSINNGALFENAVVQELLSKGHKVYYFNSKKQGELDFVIEYQGNILPIEVKSGKDYTRHHALSAVLSNEHYAISQAIVFCNENISVDNKIFYCPIYLAGFLKPQIPDQDFIFRLDLSALQ